MKLIIFKSCLKDSRSSFSDLMKITIGISISTLLPPSVANEYFSLNLRQYKYECVAC